MISRFVCHKIEFGAAQLGEIIIFRIFDKNYDGYIDKKEFKWMTNSKRINDQTIDLVFEVSFMF